MPIDPDTGLFTRSFTFVDDRAQGQAITRSDLDAALLDFEMAINAMTPSDGDGDTAGEILFASRAAAEAAEIANTVKSISVIHPPVPSATAAIHTYAISPDCTALITADGKKWRPTKVDDVRAWGASQGDDVGDDNRIAANAALFYCGAAYFPRGNWNINGMLRGRDWKHDPTLFQPIHIYGDGPHVTTLRQMDLTAITILIKHRNDAWAASGDPNDYQRVKMKPIIHDFTINYHTDAVPAAGGIAIKLHECKDGYVHNVLIDGPDYYIWCDRAAQITFLGVTGQVNKRQDRDNEVIPALSPNPIKAFFVFDHNADIAAIPGWQDIELEDGGKFRPGKSFGNRLIGCEFQGGPGCDALFVMRSCDGLEIDGCHLNGWATCFDVRELDGTGGRTTMREVSVNNTYFDCDGPGRWFMRAGPFRTPDAAVKGLEDVTITGVTIGSNVTIRGRGGKTPPQATGLVRIHAPDAGDLDNLDTFSNVKFLGTRFKALQGVGIQIRAHASYADAMKDKFKQWIVTGCEALEGQFGSGEEGDEDDDPEKAFFILSGSGHSITNNSFAGWRDQYDRHFIFAEDGTDGLLVEGNAFDMGSTKIVRRFDGAEGVRDINNTNLYNTADGEFFLDGGVLGPLRFDTRADAVLWAAGNGLAEPNFIKGHTPREGAVIMAAARWYEYNGTSTTISDMPGWKPAFVNDIWADQWPIDLTGATNDAAEVEAMLAFAGGRTLYLPTGILRMGDVTTLMDALEAGTTIKGKGQGLSTLRIGTTQVSPNFAYGLNIANANCTLEDLTIEAVAANDARAIMVSLSGSGFRARRVTFDGNMSVVADAPNRTVHAFVLSNTVDFEDALFEDCTFTALNFGWLKNNAATAVHDNIRFVNCRTLNCWSNAMTVNQPNAPTSRGFTVTGATFENTEPMSTTAIATGMASGEAGVFSDINILGDWWSAIHFEEAVKGAVLTNINARLTSGGFFDVTANDNGGTMAAPEGISLSNFSAVKIGGREGTAIRVTYDSNPISPGDLVTITQGTVKGFVTGAIIGAYADAAIRLSGVTFDDCTYGLTMARQGAFGAERLTFRNCDYAVRVEAGGVLREPVFANCSQVALINGGALEIFDPAWAFNTVEVDPGDFTFTKLATGLTQCSGTVQMRGYASTSQYINASFEVSFNGVTATAAVKEFSSAGSIGGGVEINQEIIDLDVLVEGLGYAVDDVLTLVEGTINGGGTRAQVTVTAVDGSGKITAFTITEGGTYRTLSGTGEWSVTGGTGTGATFDGARTARVLVAKVYNNHASAQTITTQVTMSGYALIGDPDRGINYKVEHGVGKAVPNTMHFETRTEAEAAFMTEQATYLTVQRHDDDAEFVSTTFERAGASTPGGLQTADGQWWAINDAVLRLEMFGAVGDGVVDDQTPWYNAALLERPIFLPEGKTYLVTNTATTNGVNLIGPGRVVKAVTGGFVQVNSVHNQFLPVVYRQHLWRVKDRIIAGEGLSMVVFGDSTATDGYGMTIADQITAEALNLGIGITGVTNEAVAGHTWSSQNLATILTGYAAQKSLVICKFGINEATGAPGISAKVTQLRNAMRQRLSEIRASTYGGYDDLSILLIMPNVLGNTATNADNDRNNLWLESIRAVYVEAARDYRCALYDPYAESASALEGESRWLDTFLVHPRPNYNLDIWTRAVRDMLAPGGNVARNRLVLPAASEDTAPALSAGLTSYPKGFSVRRIYTADGWTLAGSVVTIRQPDNTGFQLVYSYLDVTEGVRQRHWITSSNAWSDWHAGSVYLPTYTEETAPPVATALTSYRKGISMLRAFGADGWPNSGVLTTDRHPDGIGRQSIIDYQAAYPREQTRHWITASSAWSDWSGSTGAQTLTLVNSWVAYGGTYSAPKVMRTVDGLVMLSGAMKDGTTTAGTTLFTLPVGFRPPYAMILTGTILASPYQTTLDVSTAGVVSLRAAGPATGLWLDGVSFMGAV